MKTPYAYGVDLSVARELKLGYSFEVAYVGRLGHDLLQEVDLAQPLNITDPKSGMTYYQAATELVKLAQKNTPETSVLNIPYWQDLFASAAGSAEFRAMPRESQPVRRRRKTYMTFSTVMETTPSGHCSPLHTTCFPGCSQLPGQSAPTPYNYFDPQFSTLYAWKTIGHSYYNGFLFTFRRHTGSFSSISITPFPNPLI